MSGADKVRAAQRVRKHYAMYVWTTAFDRTVPSCDQQNFLQWKTNSKCFTHCWDTPVKRNWLWNTCNLTGREISAIFLSGVHDALRDAYTSGSGNHAQLPMVTQTLVEGHREVPNLKIFALLAVSDCDVSEKQLVKYIVHYNDALARSPDERFDGVAINNEAYASIKGGAMATRIQYLDDLRAVTTAAGKQQNGHLLTHYSVGWHWGECHHGNMMTWNGKTQNAVHHMMDIFDSVDVQVGTTVFPDIADRLKQAGYHYAIANEKTIYATLYTNKTSSIQTSFFPQTSSTAHHTEAAMFETFDNFECHGISDTSPCIHYFRGVYSSGGHPDWPAHESNSVELSDSNKPQLFLLS